MLVSAALLCALLGAHAPLAPRIDYRLELVPSGGEGFPLTSRPEWRVRVSGRGLPAGGGAVALVFDDWGSWQEIDSLYVDVRSADPPVEVPLLPGNAVVLQVPDGWDGHFAVELAIQPLMAGSRAQERWGLLPTWSPDYSFGQSRNVFPLVYQDRVPAAATRTVEISAPRGCPVATGWGGFSDGSQRLSLDPTEGNGFVGFGTPMARYAAETGGGRLEVVQYGRSQEVAETVIDLVRRLADHIGEATGHPAPDPLVVFITDVGGGGMGTDHGLVLGYPADTPEWQERSPYFHHLVAHELFHWWLGSELRADESFPWFHEGFTEYFSLWHLAATGAVPREWFAERIHELAAEASERSSWGAVAFADPEVSWRDGDGPNEIMAYKGGAALAFALDVELRARGAAGALLLMRDLLARDDPDVSLDDLRDWCHEHDLASFWAEHVEGTATVDVRALLEGLGYEVEQAADGVLFHASEGALDAFFTVD